MKLHRTRGPNCEEACASATTRIEKVTPAIPIIEAAMVESTWRAPSAPPVHRNQTASALLACQASSAAIMRNERMAAPADIRPGTNQKLAIRERQMLSRRTCIAGQAKPRALHIADAPDD
jgi:hypothetical protein